MDGPTRIENKTLAITVVVCRANAIVVGISVSSIKARVSDKQSHRTLLFPLKPFPLWGTFKSKDTSIVSSRALKVIIARFSVAETQEYDFTSPTFCCKIHVVPPFANDCSAVNPASP